MSTVIDTSEDIVKLMSAWITDVCLYYWYLLVLLIPCCLRNGHQLLQGGLENLLFLKGRLWFSLAFKRGLWNVFVILFAKHLHYSFAILPHLYDYRQMSQ